MARISILATLMLLGLLEATPCRGATSRTSIFQVSLTPRRQRVPEEDSIVGFRLTLPYGRNENLCGLDIGVVNSISGAATGLQCALGMNRAGNLHGIQLAGIMNSADECSGLQMSALGVNYAEHLRGLQIGTGLGGIERASGEEIKASNVAKEVIGIQIGAFGNFVYRRVVGIQIGGANYCDGSVTGVQIGLLGNKAGRVKGIQIGCLNLCHSLAGIQLGLFNIILDHKIPFLPLLNAGWSF